jgi:hypothetical protein
MASVSYNDRTPGLDDELTYSSTALVSKATDNIGVVGWVLEPRMFLLFSFCGPQLYAHIQLSTTGLVRISVVHHGTLTW